MPKPKKPPEPQPIVALVTRDTKFLFPGDAVMVNGVQCSAEFLAMFFGAGEKWTGPLWFRKDGQSIRYTNEDPHKEKKDE